MKFRSTLLSTAAALGVLLGAAGVQAQTHTNGVRS